MGSKENLHTGDFNRSEKRFRALIDNAYEGIVLYDEEGYITYVSPSVKNFGGYEEADLYNRKGIEFIHPDDKPDCYEQFAKAADNPGKSVTFRQRLQVKDGRYVWCETTLTNLLHEPSVGGIVSNFRDISAQKEAEDKLKESKFLLESINQNITEALYRNLPGEKFVYVNHAFLNLFGFDSLEELNKVKPSTLYVNDNQRMKIKKLLVENKRITNVEIKFRRKNGEEFWGLISSRLGEGSEHQEIYDGAIRDITSEKLARERLRESEQLLSSINLNIKEGIYRSTFKQGLVYVNDAFVEMFGFDSNEDVMAVNIYDLYNDAEQRETIIENLRRLGSIRNEEVLFKRKNGDTFWGLMSSYVIKEDGEEYFDGAIRDISDLKQVEDQLIMLNDELRKQNQALAAREEALNIAMKELSDRNFELDQLVYKTSHDIRSPLTSILGLVNIAKQDDTPGSKEGYLDKIEQSVMKLDDFVKSMLNYAKASRADVQIEELQLKELINGCIADLEYLDGYKRLKTTVNVKGKNHAFKTDPLRLKIIFSNIISNAFKYQDEEKENSYLNITVDIKSAGVTIKFEDNGIGIDQTHRDKIFDMFYRATEKSEGSGLGMYIVKQSIDKLGGTINIESEAKKGTQIDIFLPNTEA
ncbi:PAS domain S-box protein [Fulvivirga sp. RKSG066]|uniref:PAS domain S-box protein n=1 Tax=Fulvivirga aurantia TaxID=2529383 RepID=UPI0012BD220D|nr:PAS domain S-box protein [Fulvivirga aurantia]MTI22420.1 PAS domain S-box protein [Fulvivirga aurantia]